jgi:hypothetical protein
MKKVMASVLWLIGAGAMKVVDLVCLFCLKKWGIV